MVEPNRTTLDPAPGALIGGKYEIDRLLARGGVGVVYVARDRDNDREVVVKVLAGHLSGEAEASARFDREVERLSEIDHPNIVEVLGHGHENGTPYLVMEYLPGESMLTYLQRKGRVGLAEFVPIAAQILKALGYAHGRGLMHRDIKPGNIMLTTRRGRANFVKLLDFGMAKLVEGERDITSEQVLGTANYMAPEQVRGEPLDARVDVYACGLLFYRMLSGAPPFVADNNSALLYKQVHEVPAPLAVKMPPGHEVPAELLDLIDRCIAKDPRVRPDDANALTEALVACAPSHMFRLPLAEGADASATASTLAMVPDLTAAASGSGRGASVTSMRPIGRGGRRRKTTAQARSIGGFAVEEIDIDTDLHPTASGSVEVQAPERSKRTGLLVITAALAAAAVVVALTFAGGLEPAAAPAGANSLDDKRVAARLDQVDAMILSGDFDRAREELEVLRPQLDRLPHGVSRADALERRIAVLIGLEVARQLEQASDKGAAEKAYQDVLKLDPASRDALAGLTRVTAGPKPKPRAPEAEDEPRAKDRPGPKERSAETAEPTQPAPDPKTESLFKKSSKSSKGSVFLPTGKK